MLTATGTIVLIISMERNSVKKYGYTGLSKNLRELLAPQCYDEDDIVNAYPTIMLQVFMREGLSCPYLFRYVHEREDVFAFYCVSQHARSSKISL